MKYPLRLTLYSALFFAILTIASIQTSQDPAGGTALTCQLQFLILPLASGILLIDDIGRAFRFLSIGAFFGIVPIAMNYGVGLNEVLWAEGVTITMSACIVLIGIGIYRTFRCVRLSEFFMGFMLLFLLFSPFWSAVLPAKIALWLSPSALISVAFHQYDFSTAGKMYQIWLGSIAPYPNHPIWVLTVFGIVFAVMCYIMYLRHIYVIREKIQGS